MWSRSRGGAGRLSLAAQLLLVQLAVLGAVLVLVAVISVQQSTRSFEEERGSQLRSVAEYLASQPLVRLQLRTPSTTADTATRLAPLVSRALALSAAEDVGVAAPDGQVLASTDPTRNGEPLVLGGSRVTEGRGWSGEVTVDGRRVLAAHAPVLAADGRLLGIAVAEAEYPTVWERLTLAVPDLLLYLGLGALLGVGGSVLVSRSVRRRTRGLRPGEIATLADHREALISSIREGVIAVGTDGRVTMINDSARELLGVGADAVGRPVSAAGLPAEVEELLLTGHESQDAVLVVGARVLVFNQRAASSRGEGIGTVTTMRDRTELVSMQNQLSSNLSLTDTLRAQTHEFANQLHTISGLVQLQEYDEVVAMVGDMARRREELVRHVTARVADPAVAALVVAKTSVADEAGVALSLEDASHLPDLPPDVSADLVTVVGNLVDNAVDACREAGRPTVRLLLAHRTGPTGPGATTAGGVRVEVRDNGPGVAPSARDSLFVRGFSTKGEAPGGRGIGLALVHLICTQRGGVVTVDREAGETVFAVTLPLERGAAPAVGSEAQA